MKNKTITLSKGNKKAVWYYGNYGTSWKAKGSIKDRKISPMLKIIVEGNEPNSTNDTVTIKYQRGFTFYNQNCTTKIQTTLSFSCTDDTSINNKSPIKQDFVYKYNSQDKNLKPHEVKLKESGYSEASFTVKREFGKEKICELKMLVSRNGKNDSQLCIRIPICEKKQKVIVTDNIKYNKTFFLGKEDGINFQQLLNNPAKKVTYKTKEYLNYSPETFPSLSSINPLTFTVENKTVSQGITYNINFKASYSKDVPFSYSITLPDTEEGRNPSIKAYLSKLEPIKTGYTFIGWTLDNERLVEEPEEGQDYDFKIVNFNKNESFVELNGNKDIFSDLTNEDKFNNLTILDIDGDNDLKLNTLFEYLGSEQNEYKEEIDSKIIVNLNLAAVWQRNVSNPEDNDINNFVITPINKIQDSRLVNTNLIYGQMLPMPGDENEYAIVGYDKDGLYECIEDVNKTIEAFYPKGLKGNNVYKNQNIEKFDGNYYISLKDLYIDKNNFENNKDILLKQSDKNNLLLNIKLTPSSKIPKKLTKILLSEYGKHENTMNGLILYLNQLVDFSNTGERNFTTIKGLLNILKDEINRIGFYSVDTVSNLNYKIGKLEAKINEKLNLLDEIASDKDVEYAKNTINKRINYLLIGEEYGGSEDNKNYEFKEFLYPIGLDNNYSFFGNQVKTASNIQEAFNNVYNIIGSDGSSSSGTTVMSKIKELEQRIEDLNDTTRKLEEKQEEEKKESEKVDFEVCESSNNAFSSIRLVENNSQYNPYTNTVFISLKLALTTNKNVDKILSNANNGLPKGLVKLTRDSQKFNISSNEIALSSTQTGTNSRNYNARIEKEWANSQGVIVLSTTHDFRSNTSYGLQINGSYLLGASGEDSSGVFITYTVNGQPYSVKATQYICPSSLKVPSDIYSGTNDYKKQPFIGWYHGSEKITDSKGKFIKDTNIIDANGGFKALSSNITLEAKYGTAQTVSSFANTTWTIKKSGNPSDDTDGKVLTVPSFTSNKKTFVKIYFSYDKNGKPYTVRYHDSKGNKIKVYEKGKLQNSKYTTIKFTAKSGYNYKLYNKISGFLNHSSGTIIYK